MSNASKALWYYQPSENHDKIHITIYEDSGMVTTYWGRRGNGFQTKGKIESYAKYVKIIDEKLGKGYKEINESSMIVGLADQLTVEHGSILLKSYGISSTGKVSTKPSVPSGKASVPVFPPAGGLPKKIKVSEPPKGSMTETFNSATPAFSKGEKKMVECLNNERIEEQFEIGIDYYCTHWDGLTMLVQNMNGEETYVLPSQFKFKGESK